MCVWGGADLSLPGWSETDLAAAFQDSDERRADTLVKRQLVPGRLQLALSSSKPQRDSLVLINTQI